VLHDPPNAKMADRKLLILGSWRMVADDLADPIGGCLADCKSLIQKMWVTLPSDFYCQVQHVKSFGLFALRLC
jgi:hypothetical protein